MKHTATQSVKFVRLVRSLRPQLGSAPVSVETVAVGILERLWHATITSAPAGDIGRLTDDEIAELVGWHGESGQLVELLVKAGWVDRCDVHRLVIHDWKDHAPKFVQMNMARHKKGFVEPQGGSSKEAPLEEAPLEEAPLEEGTTKPNLTKPNKTITPCSPPRGTTPNAEQFFARWNEFCKRRKRLKRCIKLTQKRREKLLARLRDPEWYEAFCGGVKQLPLPGEGWQPTLDWLIRNHDNAFRLFEGEFEWRNEDPVVQKRRRLAREKEIEDREQRMQERREQEREEAKHRRSVISDILHPQAGNGDDPGDSSWLFGEDDDSSANGAERSKIQLE